MQQREREQTWRAYGALAGGTFFGMDLALYNTAVLQTNVANATLLGNNAPLFVGLGTWLLFQRRPRASFWLGLGLALGGCAAIVAGDARSAQASPAHATGDLLALTAAVFFAAYLSRPSASERRWTR